MLVLIYKVLLHLILLDPHNHLRYVVVSLVLQMEKEVQGSWLRDWGRLRLNECCYITVALWFESHHYWVNKAGFWHGGISVAIRFKLKLPGLPWWLRWLKRLPTMQEMWVWSLGQEDLLEKEMATHYSTLAWKIPRTEEPGRLPSMESQRVGHDWATSLYWYKMTTIKILYRKSETFLKILPELQQNKT